MELSRRSKTIRLAGGVIDVLLSGDDTDRRLELFDFHVPAGYRGPSLHVHETSQEHFNVLEGAVEFEIDGQTLRGVAGSMVGVPAGVPHTWRNTSTTPARLLVTFSPAIDMADYFRELAELVNATGKMPAPAVMEALWSRYDTAPVRPLAV